jgi:hypothetical protein
MKDQATCLAQASHRRMKSRDVLLVAHFVHSLHRDDGIESAEPRRPARRFEIGLHLSDPGRERTQVLARKLMHCGRKSSMVSSTLGIAFTTRRARKPGPDPSSGTDGASKRKSRN